MNARAVSVNVPAWENLSRWVSTRGIAMSGVCMSLIAVLILSRTNGIAKKSAKLAQGDGFRFSLRLSLCLAPLYTERAPCSREHAQCGHRQVTGTQILS